MKFYQIEGIDVFINLSMVIEIDREVNEVTMADGSKWSLKDREINEILKRVKEL